MSIVSNVAKLHSDFFVGLQEKCDRDWQQEIVDREDKDQTPDVVHVLIDREILACVADTHSESNHSEGRPD